MSPSNPLPAPRLVIVDRKTGQPVEKSFVEVVLADADRRTVLGPAARRDDSRYLVIEAAA